MFTGTPPDPEGLTITWQGIAAVLGGLLTVGAVTGLLWRVLIYPVTKLVGRTNEFFDDWFGVPERDGVPGRKGVMVRLSDLEIEKVDRADFRALADQVAATATREELQELRAALQRHIAPIAHGEGGTTKT